MVLGIRLTIELQQETYGKSCLLRTPGKSGMSRIFNEPRIVQPVNPECCGFLMNQEQFEQISLLPSHHCHAPIHLDYPLISDQL